MAQSLDNKMEKIDIGGTPSNILGKTKPTIAQSMNYSNRNMALILDPFNLARIERFLPLGDQYKIKQIKFSVEVPEGNIDLSSEAVSAPNPENIRTKLLNAKSKVIGKIIGNYGWRILDKQELERRYNQLTEEIPQLSSESPNLRHFMNSLVERFNPDLQIILLEDLFSKNQDKVYQLMEKFKIPARAICPDCNTFQNTILGDNLSCCNISGDRIIKSGKFIPEEGFFPVLTYLSGYKTFTPERREYIQRAQKILEEFGIKDDNVAVEYKIPKEQLTAVEDFLLKDLLKNDN